MFDSARDKDRLQKSFPKGAHCGRDTHASGVQRGGLQGNHRAFQGEGQRIQQSMELSSKPGRLRRLPTHTTGGKTLTVKAVPTQCSSLQSFVKRVGTPVASGGADPAAPQQLPQHAIEAQNQHHEPQKLAGQSFSHSKPPVVVSVEAVSPPPAEVLLSGPPDDLPAPTSFPSEEFKCGRKQPASVTVKGIHKVAPSVAKAEFVERTCASTLPAPPCIPPVLGTKDEDMPKPLSSSKSSRDSPSQASAEEAAHDPLIPTAKNIKVNIDNSSSEHNQDREVQYVAIPLSLVVCRRMRFGFKQCGGATK